MTKLIDLAVEHFNSLGVREVIIPEWGDTKVFMKNFSLEDKAKLSARAQEDTWDYLCYTVIFGLVDGEGNAVFDIGDKVKLKRFSASGIVERLATAILAHQSETEEEREKN